MVNFFQKLGLGLKKTSENLSKGITDIFTKEALSKDTITDLEDLLYSSDVGVKATSEILSKFSSKITKPCLLRYYLQIKVQLHQRPYHFSQLACKAN